MLFSFPGVRRAFPYKYSLPGARRQSTWFPLYDRNPQRFVPNVFAAKPEDFRAQTHRLWHTHGIPRTSALP
jgi:hypothetical protein